MQRGGWRSDCGCARVTEESADTGQVEAGSLPELDTRGRALRGGGLTGWWGSGRMEDGGPGHWTAATERGVWSPSGCWGQPVCLAGVDTGWG